MMIVFLFLKTDETTTCVTLCVSPHTLASWHLPLSLPAVLSLPLLTLSRTGPHGCDVTLSLSLSPSLPLSFSPSRSVLLCASHGHVRVEFQVSAPLHIIAAAGISKTVMMIRIQAYVAISFFTCTSSEVNVKKANRKGCQKMDVRNHRRSETKVWMCLI